MNEKTTGFSHAWILKLQLMVDLLVFIFSSKLLYLKSMVTGQNLIAKNSIV